MVHFQSTSRLSIVAFFIAIIYLLLSSTIVSAKAGCCSKHGGVVGCDNATGYQLCKDGKTSPTCTCSGQTIKKSKAAAKTATKPVPIPSATTQTTAPKTVTTTKASKAYRAAGCCSGHGGVAKCNTKKGHKVCKDGTLSATCSC